MSANRILQTLKQTQIGAGVVRVHSDSAVKSRMLSSFILAAHLPKTSDSR